jgi:hypothetical protein
MFAQSSGINPYYKFDVDLKGEPQLNLTPATSLKSEDDDDPVGEPSNRWHNTDSDPLPDRPVPKIERRSSPLGSPDSDFTRSDSPPMGFGAYRDSNADYWALTASVYGSNIAAIELLQGCLGNNRCHTLPVAMRGRPAMYVTGLGVATGVSYLGYALRKRQERWWFVPAVLATTFDLVFVVRAAKRQ